MTHKAWLARLAFSLLIVAFALAWSGHRRIAGGDQGWVPRAQVVGGFACAALGIAGVRLRHRDSSDGSDER